MFMMRRFFFLYICLFMRKYCLTFALSDVITKSTSTIPDEDEKIINLYLCQGETLNITCPKNFVIVFDDANFGRGHSDSERCTQFWGIESTHCDHHEHTLKVLNDKCHDQQTCLLPVDKTVFGNPCFIVTEYLYVKYHCKRQGNHGLENSNNSATFEQTTYDGKDMRDDRKGKLDRKDRKNDRKKHLCQGETLNITCPKNFVMLFDDANFGRGLSDSERCSQFWGIESTHCDHHEHTLKVLNDECHEQQTCLLPVNKAIFGNPCFFVTKYLYVKYHCKRQGNHGLENSDYSANIEQTTCDGKEIGIRDDGKSELDRKDRNNDRKKHSITTSILTTHYDKQPIINPSILTTENVHHYSTKVKKNTKEIKASMDMIIVVSALVSISIAASVTITVMCYQRHQSKHSLTRSVRQDQIITERVDSSNYTAIWYNEMTDMSLPETNENYYENNTTPREPQAITDIIQQTGDTLTEYESLSNYRTSVEQVYESESTQNQYQLLTTQRNLSVHTYESTEPELHATTESDLHQYFIVIP
ncbi:uncharacterized protein LOC134726860 [Mytilus trossulus]|uniref:uncharacterized protein LOC134726860 n=1 Tax=Mytilus trossulus TaxID=6551 RepID=UPI003006C7A7